MTLVYKTYDAKTAFVFTNGNENPVIRVFDWSQKELFNQLAKYMGGEKDADLLTFESLPRRAVEALWDKLFTMNEPAVLRKKGE